MRCPDSVQPAIPLRPGFRQHGPTEAVKPMGWQYSQHHQDWLPIGLPPGNTGADTANLSGLCKLRRLSLTPRFVGL